MKTLQSKLTVITAALGFIAGQMAPAQTFRERVIERGSTSAEDIDAAFTEDEEAEGASRFTFGSYGEAHFNTGDVPDKFDIHRLVLFTGIEITEFMRFISEVELEHLYSNDPGTDLTWELEQAFFEFDLGNDYHLQAGALLVPVGITNEIHEPTTFYGVERNKIETEIIPSTWTEYGVLLRKNYDNGLQWDVAFHRGLNVRSNNVNLNGPDIRSGRQKTDSFYDLGSAATARIRYTGISGLEIGGAVQYQDDITHSGDDNNAVLTSGHFIYNRGDFSLRGLAANWVIGGDTAVDGDVVSGRGIANQYGGYIEPSYKWTFANNMAVGVFGRALYWKNEDAPDGQTNYQAGINFWPTENTVLKFDYERQDRSNGRDDLDVFNFGIGYAF